MGMFGLLIALTYSFLFAATTFLPPLKKREESTQTLMNAPRQNHLSVASQLQKAASALTSTIHH
jgi:hypothetical protein